MGHAHAFTPTLAPICINQACMLCNGTFQLAMDLIYNSGSMGYNRGDNFHSPSDAVMW